MGMLGLNGSNTIRTSNMRHTRNTMEHSLVRNITSSMAISSISSISSQAPYLMCHMLQLLLLCLLKITILILLLKPINSHSMVHNNLRSNFNLLINSLHMVIMCHHISNHHSSGRYPPRLGHRNHQALTIAVVAVVVLLTVVEVMMLP
jgi:hypothetical protein